MLSARQVLFTGPRAVTLADVKLRDPEPGQLLVRTRFSGISAGTELLAYRGRLNPTLARDETLGAFGGTFAHPFSYGYSCVSRVERGTAASPYGAPLP